jgi:ABC-type ATPase with predicted acetyltransferase domain
LAGKERNATILGLLKYMHNNDILIKRTESPQGSFSLLKDMIVERGTIDDWYQLHELHYKSEGRVVGRTWRVMLGEQLVAVAIISSPRLLLAGRHEVFPKLKPGRDTKITNTYRAKLVNKKFSVASRIVVDTLFRAGGVSYRFLNLVARMEGKEFLEIQSSMSRFNPFAIKAGMKFTKPREAAAYDKGLRFLTRLFECHPADQEGLLTELHSMSNAHKNNVLKQLREFYYRHSALEKTGSNLGTGTSKVDAMPVVDLVKNIQQLVFGSPMYGVYQNPDADRELPAQLPLLLFDNQLPNQKLRLNL